MARAVVFDADGTLLDSLPPHVEFCRAMAAARPEDESCAVVSASLPASEDLPGMRALSAAPMDNFLRRAGFADPLILELVAEYESSFAARFPVVPFAGVAELLAALRDGDGAGGGDGLRLAVVTSNTAANVRCGLGEVLSARFEVISGIDNGPLSKQDAIGACLRKMGLGEPGSEAVRRAALYVGDTEKDCASARANGLDFVGVDFGFEQLSTAGLGCPVAHDVGELTTMLAAWRNGDGLPRSAGV